MSVRMDYTANLTVAETLETNVTLASSTGRKITYNGVDTQAANQISTSTPPVTKAAVFPKALAAGVATIDLTALTGSNGAAVTGSGLRVQAIKFKAAAANAAAVTIVKGASNGYDGLGAAFSIALAAGAEVTIRTLDGGTDISGTNKTFDLSGTGTDSVDVAMVMG